MKVLWQNKFSSKERRTYRIRECENTVVLPLALGGEVRGEKHTWATAKLSAIVMRLISLLVVSGQCSYV